MSLPSPSLVRSSPFVPALCLCALLACAGIANANPAEVLTLRSGKATPGYSTPRIAMTVGSRNVPLSGSQFTPADFDGACGGSQAVVLAPFSTWLKNLTDDPLAKWIGTDLSRGPASALFCDSFCVVRSACVDSASLELHWAVDDRLGDGDPASAPFPNPSGIYLNGNAISSINGGRWNQEKTASAEVTSFVVPGFNRLQIYDRDIGALVSGVMFSATIKVFCDAPVLQGATSIFTWEPDTIVIPPCPHPPCVWARLDFHKKVEKISAEDLANYQLASFGTVNYAAFQPDSSSVLLDITNGLGHKVTETISVSGVRAADNGMIMVGVQSATFWNGLTPIADIQSPDAAALAASPCDDRSLMAGPGEDVGPYPVTFRGVCTAAFPGALYYLQDSSVSTRGGIAVYVPDSILTVGHQYLVTCTVQEYEGETAATNISDLRDGGAATMPAPVAQTVAVLRNTACDATESITNGEDYEGMLVKLNWVKAVNNASAPGEDFDVVGPIPMCGDTIRIRNVQSSTGWAYQADSSMYLDVTGILTFSGGAMQVAPRSNADFTNHGLAAVPEGAPTGVSFSVSPNPARVTTVSFGLPRQSDVELAVFDLLGRRVATLAQGSMPAGRHAREWKGTNVNAGVYFVRLRVGAETYKLRTITLK
jgi:hypothetical protein